MGHCYAFLPVVLLLVQDSGEAQEAHRLLQEAQATQAYWHDFPGFLADIEVEFAGKTRRGRVVIARDGRVFVEHLPEPHRAWVTAHLGCLVRQRLPQKSSVGKSWVFQDGPGVQGPLGTALVCVEDPFGVIIWIDGRQVRALECYSHSHKFRKTALRYDRNPHNKFLPAVVVLRSWKMEQLESTQVALHFWKRLNGFDLPSELQIVTHHETAEPKAPTVGRLTLSNYRLLTASGK